MPRVASNVNCTCVICGAVFVSPTAQAHRRLTCSIQCRSQLQVKRWEDRMQDRFGEPIADVLRRMYVDERRPTTVIAKLLELTTGSGGVSRLLRRYDIPRRSVSEAISLSWEGNTDRKKAAADNMRQVSTEHYNEGAATRAEIYRRNPTKYETLVADFLTLIKEPYETQVCVGPYIADFVLRKRWIIVEVDSGHHSDAHIVERDVSRDAFFQDYGYTTHRVRHAPIERYECVLLRLCRILEDAPKKKYPGPSLAKLSISTRGGK